MLSSVSLTRWLFWRKTTGIALASWRLVEILRTHALLPDRSTVLVRLRVCGAHTWRPCSRQESGQQAADQASSTADDALKRLNEATDGAAQQVVDAVREKVRVLTGAQPHWHAIPAVAKLRSATTCCIVQPMAQSPK